MLDILAGRKVDNEVDTERDSETIKREWARTAGLRWRAIINLHWEAYRQTEVRLVAQANPTLSSSGLLPRTTQGTESS
jgi:hypothetical protein